MKKLSAILAFVLVLLTFTACGTGSYEKEIKAQYDAIIEEDAQAYLDCFANEAYIEYLIDQSEDDDLDDEKDVLKAYKETVKNTLDQWEDDKEGYGLGKNIKVEIEVLDVVEFEDSDVTLFADYLEERYDYDKETIDDVVVVTYIRRLTGEEGYLRNTFTDALIKIDGDWYISEHFSDVESIFDAIIRGIDGDKNDLGNAIDSLYNELLSY